MPQRLKARFDFVGLSNLVERSREIGVLKAVGWTEKDIQKQLMGEAFLQSLLGGLE